MLISLAIIPAAAGAMTLARNLPLAMVCLVFAGVGGAINQAMESTLFLLTAREDMRGRVMSLYTMLGSLQAIGAFAMGIAITKWSPNEAVLGFQVAAIALMGLSAIVFPAVRRP